MYFMRLFECADCGHYWEIPFGKPQPRNCPKCGSKDVLQGLFDGHMDSEMLDPHLFS
ncbi:MAG: hypothetical protein QW520_08485 [Methanomassiliicoccales archaeon]